ncbi:Uncharacterized membrane protein YgdD, TMEM256/DUF423 family [Lysobacter sp. yr284]|uniref:hypothetical protein n=1 Tax=Lysobacter TaxID=68 RepID=UPI000898994F|nr:hypothetical protein [Lysobacter sp. yr284]SDY45650.1 Uncharacterized membrane protein YgdD, TMEM256/DUF423 family [Lysobacter sp. yr284]
MSASASDTRIPAPLSARLLAASGAVLAALAVALSAYAAHAAADPHAQARLQSAAVFAFGHGIALAALAPPARRAFTRAVLGALLLGVLGFAGSLAAAHFFGASTRLAPYGGSLMILAWLAYAADAVRR